MIMCDGCDNSFHASCFDPPMDMGELGEDSEWYCHVCIQNKHRPRYPSRWVDQLCFGRDVSNPKSFSLPVGIRNYFVGGECGVFEMTFLTLRSGNSLRWLILYF